MNTISTHYIILACIFGIACFIIGIQAGIIIEKVHDCIIRFRRKLTGRRK